MKKWVKILVLTVIGVCGPLRAMEPIVKIQQDVESVKIQLQDEKVEISEETFESLLGIIDSSISVMLREAGEKVLPNVTKEVFNALIKNLDCITEEQQVERVGSSCLQDLATNPEVLDAAEYLGIDAILNAARSEFKTNIQKYIKAVSDNETRDFERQLKVAAKNPQAKLYDLNADEFLFSAIRAKAPLGFIKLLLKAGADANKRGGLNRTALMEVFKDDSSPRKDIKDLVKLLLNAGAEVNAIGGDLLSSAFTKLLNSRKYNEQEKYELAMILIEAGMDPKKDPYQLTTAAREGYRDIVTLLLDAGAGVNTPDKGGGTALIRAVENGHTDMIRLLLAEGADANVTDASFSVLVYLLLSNKYNEQEKNELVGILVKAGMDLKKDPASLRIAAGEGYRDIVKLLLDAGVGVNTRDKDRNTALIAAADRGHTDIVKSLLAKGADINLQAGFDKNSALIKAADGGRKDVVIVLLAAGADKTLKNRAGRTAAMEAVRRLAFAYQASKKEYNDIIDLLES